MIGHMDIAGFDLNLMKAFDAPYAERHVTRAAIRRLASPRLRRAALALFSHSVVAIEEPGLRESFGAEYESYCADVPRWLPRLAPRAV